jgi:uncharacterized sodium:solute symporter family permease YidK
MGLLMNGFVKVPMQFLILLIGTLVFTFYQFNKAPVFFNDVGVKKLELSVYKDSFALVNQQYDATLQKKQQAVVAYISARDENETAKSGQSLIELQGLQKVSDSLRKKVKDWLDKKEMGGDGNDTNYIFLRFVVDNLPVGLVGLLIAIIFLASWGSIAAAINALASCTMVDFHRRFTKKKDSSEEEYRISKLYTLGWGVFCIVIAMYTYNLGNSLIETVNELGSLFYGSILGVFLVAFFIKKINNGNVVFYAALITELMVLIIYIISKMKIISLGFLWLNPIGALGVVLFSLLLNTVMTKKIAPKQGY